MGTMGERNFVFNGNMTAIRTAIPTDIDTIHQILDMEPFKYDENLPYEREWIELLVSHERCITLVYETDQEVKGFICGEIMVSNSVMLWFCAVKPTWQHKHIGIRLYKAFEELCKSRNIKGILTYGFKTSADMLDRLKFYSNDYSYKEFYKVLQQD